MKHRLERGMLIGSLLPFIISGCGPAKSQTWQGELPVLATDTAPDPFWQSVRSANTIRPSSEIEARIQQATVFVTHRVSEKLYNSCNGTFVAPDQVLTAEHCVPPDPTTVKVSLSEQVPGVMARRAIPVDANSTLLELEGPVKGIEPAEIRGMDGLSLGDPLFLTARKESERKVSVFTRRMLYLGSFRGVLSAQQPIEQIGGIVDFSDPNRLFLVLHPSLEDNLQLGGISGAGIFDSEGAIRGTFQGNGDSAQIHIGNRFVDGILGFAGVAATPDAK